ncbi:hypothetical protein, partial [Helicobacter burdigaliensis]|uniref:hypothetical protein n=1 Tax=Helicobacter burdigaliensis TaxID=2315334 RepID=UPI0039EC1C7E
RSRYRRGSPLIAKKGAFCAWGSEEGERRFCEKGKEVPFWTATQMLMHLLAVTEIETLYCKRILVA